MFLDLGACSCGLQQPPGRQGLLRGAAVPSLCVHGFCLEGPTLRRAHSHHVCAGTVHAVTADISLRGTPLTLALTLTRSAPGAAMLSLGM